MKLCEKTGRRLRRSGYTASGLRLWLTFANHQYWSQGRDTQNAMYSTQDIYLQAEKMLKSAYIMANVSNMSVTVYKLASCYPEQVGLFDGSRMDTRSLSRAADEVNDTYGEFTVIPAIMAGMDDIILDRIAFGNVKELY